MRSFTADDLYRHEVISAVNGTIRSSVAVFVVKKALREKDAYSRRIWMAQTARPEITPLSTDEESATSPKLSTDASKLAFLSDRGKSIQLHLLDLACGDARPLTRTEGHKISAIESWSNDDSQLLVIASVAWNEDGEAAPRDGSRGPQVIRHLPYKMDGIGITVGRRTHLFAVEIATGSMHALTDGDFDVKNGAWSADGTRLAYVRSRAAVQRHRHELWIASSDGTGHHKLCDDLASIAGMSWSPDGSQLAVAGALEDGDSRARGWTVDVNTGALDSIGDVEIEPTGPFVWSKDGTRIAFVASHRGLREAQVFCRATQSLTRLRCGLRHVLEIVACGDRLALVAASMRRFCEVYSMTWDGADLQRHTDLNGWCRQRTRPRVAKRRFEVPAGGEESEKIDAWLLRPPFGQGPFPLLVDFHGGPHSIALVDFDAHAYWYDLCSRGWAVLAVNPVGSGSYGDEFAYRIRGRWGELDLPQVMSVVQQLQAEGFADDRIACTGKSYGGFLSAWAIGHSPMFRAAVVCAPVSNIVSHAGTSDTGYYVTPFSMGAELNEDPERYRRLSPIGYCNRVGTATLILQGENDGRCPRGQAEELFAHLVRCSRCPVEMAIYPESTHAVAESGAPSNRRDYHQRLANWVEKYAGVPLASANDLKKQ